MEGVGTQNGPAPNLHVVDENWEGYLRHGGARNPSLTPGSQPGVLVPGRRVPTTSGCEKQQGFQPSGWDQRWRETQDILLKSLHTDSLTGTHPGLWQRDSDSGCQRHMGDRCMSSGCGLEDSWHFYLCGILLLCSRQVDAMLPVFSPPPHGQI